MKNLLVISAVVSALSSTHLFGGILVLPRTMDSASVQAKLKGLLYENLEKNGPTNNPFGASLTGSYSKVTLEDRNAKVVCRENSAGMLAVQTFACEITDKTDRLGALNSLELAPTMDSASVQAVIKELPFDKLQSDGPVTSEFEANLTGNYTEVTLEDKNSKVECTERSAAPLAVQTFGCTFELKSK